MLINLELLVLIAKYEFGHPKIYGLANLFMLDLEQNVPTWFSSFLILLSSMLLAVICLTLQSNADRTCFYWGSLAVLFLFLSIDEAAGVHELLMSPVRNYFNTSGFFYFAWVIPAMLVVLACAIIYLRFLLSLPRDIMLRMILAAFIYVSGAIGMEMVSGAVRSYNGETEGTRSLTYEMVVILEESLEMIGMAFFIYTLLIYLASQKSGVSIAADRRSRGRDKKRNTLTMIKNCSSADSIPDTKNTSNSSSNTHHN
ncbi:MAG: hypothetical protein F3745_00660 [Nitrospinae bacterium]|nr:hypothetical protein [Nitrospinota bacterium]